MIPADIRENMSTDSVCTIGIGICNQTAGVLQCGLLRA
jgi:hypothetical protein